MIQVQRIVRVPTAPGPAADFLFDFTTTAIWDPHTEDCVRIDSGPVGVGAQYRNTQRIAGRASVLDYEVADLDPGHRIRLVGSGKSVQAQDTIIVDADGRGLRITYIAEFVFTGAQRYAEPLLRLVLNRIADDGAAGMELALTALARRPA